MKRRILSLLLALCMIVGLLPAVAMPHAHAEVKTATVTLWGTAVTIDLDATTDYPEALYWVNGADGDFPTTDGANANNWNYSFTIEGGFPTVTIRGAKYHNKTVAFLDNTVKDLKLAYQGKENFINTEHHRIISSDTSMSIVAIGDASLTGYGRVVMSSTGTLTLNDGTITITRLSNQTLSLLDFKKSTVTVNNCNLNLNDNKSGKAYPLAQGKTLNITNSNVTMESGSYVTLGGTMNAYYDAISAAVYLTVNGNSNVKIINNCTTAPNGDSLIGIGIANNDPNRVVVNGGTLEVQGAQIAMNKAPAMTDYVKSCDMFTADGKVDEYAESTYFKVAPPSAVPEEPACKHTGAIEHEAKSATCKEAGNTAYWHCEACNKYFSDAAFENEIPVDSWVLPQTNDHTPAEDDGDCTTAVECTVCGAVTTAAKDDHTPALDDGDCTTPIKCTVCDTVTTPAASHTGGTATCSALAKCDNCGKEYGNLDASNHKYTNYKYNNDATYNADGTETATCDNGCGETDTRTKAGTMLTGAVAEANGVKYGTLTEALAAGGVIKLLADASIDAETVLTAGNTYIIPAGLTLTVNAKVTADEGAILNCYGTIVVNAATDISKLVYGETFGACGGKLTVKANGSVAMLDEWVGVWTPLNDAKLGAMLKDCETGATITVGTQNWQLAESGWEHLNHVGGTATCSALAKCEICGKEYGELNANNHKFTDYKYNNDATYNADGTETATCDNGCGETDTRTKAGTMLTGAVAQIGETKYGTLADALAKVEDGQTVTLLEDVTTALITVDGIKLTIDLGGKTLTRDGNSIFYIINGGELTVTDGTLVSTGGNAAIYSYGDGVKKNAIKLNGVTLNSAWFGVYHNGLSYGVDVQIINSNITDTKDDGAGVFLSGNAAWGAENQNTLRISAGSTIKGATAVEVKYTDVTVENSELIATADKTVADNANGSCTTGYALALTNNGNEATIGSITLEGTNTLTGGAMVKAGNTVNVTTNAPEKVEAPADYKWVGEVLTAKDYVAQVGDTKYESLQTAINEAESGATVTLLDDITISAYINITKSITLDLVEHTITREDGTGLYINNADAEVVIKNGTIDASKNAIFVGAAKKVEITDCTAICLTEDDAMAAIYILGGEVVITNANVTAYGPAVWAQGNSAVTIVSGDFVGGNHAAYAKENASIDIEGGKFSINREGVGHYVVNKYDSDIETASIVIKGGEFKDFDPADNKADGAGTNYLADETQHTAVDAYGYYAICTKTAKDPVKDAESEVAADCTNAGSYDMVVYCECGKELSRETTTVPATGHVNTTTTETIVDATCTTAGSKTTAVTCACSEVVSTTTDVIPAKGHIDENGDDYCDNCSNKIGGIINGFYYENGEIVKSKGLVEIDGNIYYIDNNGQVAKGEVYVAAAKTNSFVCAGYYVFDEETGAMKPHNGIYRGFYYVNNEIAILNSLIEIDGKIYFIGSKGQVAKGEYYVSAEKANNLVQAGIYKFDADTGVMEMNHGIVNGVYYENGSIVANKGLIKDGEEYFYVGSKGQLVKGEYYVSAAKTNGFVSAGYYVFDEETGAMKPHNGIYRGFYYVNNEIAILNSLIEIDGKIYFIGSKGQVAKGEYYVSAQKANNLVKAGIYKFDATTGELVTGN